LSRHGFAVAIAVVVVVVVPHHVMLVAPPPPSQQQQHWQQQIKCADGMGNPGCSQLSASLVRKMMSIKIRGFLFSDCSTPHLTSLGLTANGVCPSSYVT